jgi:hypothetical protein
VEINPGQQLNRLFSELFPEVPSFRGTLRIGTIGESGLPTKSLSALIVQFGGGQFFEIPTVSFTKSELEDQ